MNNEIIAIFKSYLEEEHNELNQQVSIYQTEEYKKLLETITAFSEKGFEAFQTNNIIEVNMVIKFLEDLKKYMHISIETSSQSSVIRSIEIINNKYTDEFGLLLTETSTKILKSIADKIIILSSNIIEKGKSSPQERIINDKKGLMKSYRDFIKLLSLKEKEDGLVILEISEIEDLNFILSNCDKINNRDMLFVLEAINRNYIAIFVDEKEKRQEKEVTFRYKDQQEIYLITKQVLRKEKEILKEPLIDIMHECLNESHQQESIDDYREMINIYSDSPHITKRILLEEIVDIIKEIEKGSDDNLLFNKLRICLSLLNVANENIKIEQSNKREENLLKINSTSILNKTKNILKVFKSIQENITEKEINIINTVIRHINEEEIVTNLINNSLGLTIDFCKYYAQLEELELLYELYNETTNISTQGELLESMEDLALECEEYQRQTINEYQTGIEKEIFVPSKNLLLLVEDNTETTLEKYIEIDSRKRTDKFRPEAYTNLKSARKYIEFHNPNYIHQNTRSVVGSETNKYNNKIELRRYRRGDYRLIYGLIKKKIKTREDLQIYYVVNFGIKFDKVNPYKYATSENTYTLIDKMIDKINQEIDKINQEIDKIIDSNLEENEKQLAIDLLVKTYINSYTTKFNEIMNKLEIIQPEKGGNVK